MLKFWKKSGQNKSSESEFNSTSSPTSSNSSPPQFTVTSDVISHCKLETVSPKFSRLSKPLVKTIQDSESLGYFLHYLETMNTSALLKCLMDVDNLNSCLVDNPAVVSWNDVRGLRRVETATGIMLDFSNGVSYSNNIGCDISSYCVNGKKESTKVLICAASQATLTEMQEIEQEVLAKLLADDKVAESTVDALKIFYKYFSHVAPFKIIVSIDVFRKLLDKLKKNVDRETYGEMRELLLLVLEKEYYLKYLRSDSHCKYQMSILTSPQLCVSDILYNESALFYFMEHLEVEGCRGLLEFWMAANNYQQQFANPCQAYAFEHAQDDAMVLYNKYFSLQASHPLNLGDQVRFLVEESICREGGPLPSCFDAVQNLIVMLLEKHFFRSFLQSQLFFKYLSELISTVDAGPSRPSGGSDCSSEVSISTTSSPMTSEAHELREKPNLSIDTRSLYDPDSLWRRRKHSGLTLGRVNSLGRFQTDLEPRPHGRVGLETRISKAMKKWVNMEEDTSKEELAWQVAEMIVKDVTNLTMPPHLQSPDHLT